MVSNRTSLNAYTQHLNFISVLRQRIRFTKQPERSIDSVWRPEFSEHVYITIAAIHYAVIIRQAFWCWYPVNLYAVAIWMRKVEQTLV